jgi:hypothetical protein
LADPALALRLYSRRMWIEGMFGDWKDNGFEIEALRLRHFARLSRCIGKCFLEFYRQYLT